MARRRRERYPDVGWVGRSKACPYVLGEPARARHWRRLETNLSMRQDAEWFCFQNHIQFRVRNEGHHWQFRKGGKMIEWWPSSAKLVLFQQWDQGVHVFDWNQVKRILVYHNFACDGLGAVTERLSESSTAV